MKMKKLILVTALLALPLISCSHYESRRAVAAENSKAETSKDWTQRRDEFVSGSQAKLTEIYKNVEHLEQKGKLVKNSDARKAKNEAEDLRKDITDLKKDIDEDARKVEADDWEKKHIAIQSDVNDVEQKYHELKSRYR
jgi:hypothetical protein